ncbi:MAG: T9SS type A sorting domain-containing protein [Bacteroidota bacterium]
MNKIIFCTCLLCLLGLGEMMAQTISRSVIGATGSSNEQLSYTVGETVIHTGTSNANILTQGFQQPDTTVTTFLDPQLGEVNLTLYPNPATDQLFLDLEGKSQAQYRVKIFDMRGRQVIAERTVTGDSRSVFDVSDKAKGTYLMLIQSVQGKILDQLKFEITD